MGKAPDQLWLPGRGRVQGDLRLYKIFLSNINYDIPLLFTISLSKSFVKVIESSK